MLWTALTLALALPAQIPGEDLQERYGARLTPEAQVFRRVAPSVVSVKLLARAGIQGYIAGLGGEIGGYLEINSGTGVIYSENGLVITNGHVVSVPGDRIPEDALRVEISFPPEFAPGGQTDFEARVLSIDRAKDLALLKIQSDQTFPPVPLGISSDLLVGERVVVIGAPYGQSHSLSAGMLSGLGRKVTVDIPGGDRIPLDGLIQTDAAINYGSSGGPMFNINSEMIGIAVARHTQGQGLSFAIPVDQVVSSLEGGLLDGGMSTRFWAGMKVLERDGFPEVVSVHPRGPAAEAGIRPGDRIIRLQGKAITTFPRYASALMSHSAGDNLDLVVERNRKAKRFEVPLLATSARDQYGLLGMDLERTSIMVNVPRQGSIRENCVRVRKVYQGSPAERLGLQPGDFIVAVADSSSEDGPAPGWTRVHSVADMVSMVRSPSFKQNESNVWIIRGQSSFYGHLQLDDPEVVKSGASIEGSAPTG